MVPGSVTQCGGCAAAVHGEGGGAFAGADVKQQVFVAVGGCVVVPLVWWDGAPFAHHAELRRVGVARVDGKVKLNGVAAVARHVNVVDIGVGAPGLGSRVFVEIFSMFCVAGA